MSQRLLPGFLFLLALARASFIARCRAASFLLFWYALLIFRFSASNRSFALLIASSRLCSSVRKPQRHMPDQLT